jgi:nitrogen regulatory protein PII
MKKSIYTTCGILIFCASTSMAQFDKLKKTVGDKIESTAPTSSALSEEEVGSGLREALTKGVEKGVNQLSKPDGYFGDLEIKIPLPEEAANVEAKLRSMGQGQKVDDAIESINRAAEDAAIGAKDIFVDAIKSMTLTDAMSILRGEDNAATNFLDKATREALVIKFKPIVKASLDKVGATKNWNAIFTTYNKIPLVTKVNPDLEEYATNKAIDGLFIQIAKEELAIRKDPAARVSDLLKKVFG